jgi:hypothetical protein
MKPETHEARLLRSIKRQIMGVKISCIASGILLPGQTMVFGRDIKEAGIILTLSTRISHPPSVTISHLTQSCVPSLSEQNRDRPSLKGGSYGRSDDFVPNHWSRGFDRHRNRPA